MKYATIYILPRIGPHLYIYCRKALGEHVNIQIAKDYEMKLKIYFISSFWLNLFEYIDDMSISFTFKCLHSDPL